MMIKTFFLFSVTAFFEIFGCYLAFLVIKEEKSALLILPSFISLALFTFLLTLHPIATGRVYAAYGGVYVMAAFLWLYFVDKAKITTWDMLGVAVSLVGMIIILNQPTNQPTIKG